MAIIQLKRRTNKTGSLTGNTGSVKSGEPLVNLTTGTLYISKNDKTASDNNPLTDDDYIVFIDEKQVKSKTDDIQRSVNDVSLKLNKHISDDDSHLDRVDREKLDNFVSVDIARDYSVNAVNDIDTFKSKTLQSALVIYEKLEEGSYSEIKEINIGIDVEKVLTPNSTIDGGTY